MSHKFTETLDWIARGSIVAHSVKLGKQLNLFDLLASNSSEQTPITSLQLADKAQPKLKQRYVEEWLCAMAAAYVVHCTENGSAFWMTKEEADELKEHPYLTFSFGFAEDLVTVFDQIAECFKEDGPNGTTYDQYPKFHSVMEKFSKPLFEGYLVQEILPALDTKLCADFSSGGLRALDVGCGSGTAVEVMARAFTKSHFVADLCEDAVATARERTASLENVEFQVLDATNLNEKSEWKDYFDLVTLFDALHDQAFPDKCLQGIKSIVRPGGWLLCQDVRGTSNVFQDRKLSGSVAGMEYTCSLFHCMPVSLNTPNGRGFGSMWGKQRALNLFAEGGLENVHVKKLAFDDSNFYYCWRKP